MAEDWVRAIGRDELTQKGRAVFRRGRKQIVLFATPDGVRACDNRCPHEGYPLRAGTLDESCVLTCNWHNWKFDLRSGENLYGGDALRVYPVDVRDGAVWLDLTEAPLGERRARAMANLRDAFDDHDYERIAREIARLGRIGAEPVEAVVEAVQWSHDRFEFGWTHAYAAAADWLALHDRTEGDDDARLACLVEIVGHIADDTLRQPSFAYAEGARDYDPDALVAAIEAEDEATAIALARGAFAAGLGFDAIEPALSRAALAHYNDFGHSLIYVAKAGPLIARLGPRVALPLTLALIRRLVFARREDLIPDFRAYAPALEAWSSRRGRAARPTAAAFKGLNTRKALARTLSFAGAPPMALYDALLGANAANMLAFDLAHQDRVAGQIKDNVGWLDFTHGLTFANAVRRQCEKYPALWPAGLLQMACFAGRNAPYTLAEPDLDRWRVADARAFFDRAVAGLFDHGREEYIVSAHLLKTTLAAREEVLAGGANGAAPLVTAALNRFLNSPLKRKHVRRAAHQARAFVALAG